MTPNDKTLTHPSAPDYIYLQTGNPDDPEDMSPHPYPDEMMKQLHICKDYLNPKDSVPYFFHSDDNGKTWWSGRLFKGVTTAQLRQIAVSLLEDLKDMP